jgi:hypothetical protein
LKHAALTLHAMANTGRGFAHTGQEDANDKSPTLLKLPSLVAGLSQSCKSDGSFIWATIGGSVTYAGAGFIDWVGMGPK